MTARPFLKWVGGKTRLLEQIRAVAPRQYGRYFEPFVGGGAVFFDLAPDRAVLNDANLDLIATYSVVADNVEHLIDLLVKYQVGHSETQYYGTRTLFNEDTVEHVMSPVQRAAAFIYLNKTCFNGLWRVNKDGDFNVPMGKYKNPKICDVENLRAVSQALRRVTFRAGDFNEAVMDAGRGDFVYFDPPYHDTFTSYTAGSFDENAQAALALCAHNLAARGVHVVLSNNDTPLIRKLYAGFHITEVQCTRAVNSDGAGRGAVTELLISRVWR